MTDPAFRNISKNQGQFCVWRIEAMKVVAVPKLNYGKLHKGDSYIVLSLKDTKGPLEAHIHFWLGKETSQDEAGVAAYKSVELDEYLGGYPVQHREVQGAETNLFRSYFPKGIQYLEGGFASGFKHVDNTFTNRLFLLKGKHHVIAQQVDLEWASFNSGDVFLVDCGQLIFVWNGSSSSRTERIKGQEQARNFRDERKGGNIVTINEGEEDLMTDKEKKIFNGVLPLSEKKIKPAEAGGADASVSANMEQELKLYRCTEEGGTLKVTEVKKGPLHHSDLDTSDSFIVDNGEKGIWCWIGKRSTKKEKNEAMRNALGFIKVKGRSNTTNVTRVVEMGEPSEFKCLFRSWPMPQSSGKAFNNNKIAKTVQTKFDAATLHSNRALAAETQMVDDGTGQCEIWRVKGFDVEAIEKRDIGRFFGGDCYVIKYTYRVNGKDHYIIYYWQGLKSTTDEKGVSALKAVEFDGKLGGAAVQVRVVQGKEPLHFTAMFDGKMVIFSSGHAGGFEKSDPTKKSEGPGDKYMLQVRGTNLLNTKAVQVPLEAASLNSNDSFVVFTKTANYIWCGKGSVGDERECAKHIAKSQRDPIMVFEGQEKSDFWNAIGGQGEYSSDKHLQEPEGCHPPRLFQLSNASGKFEISEIPEFSQQDCICDDVMILDAWDNVFVWIGDHAREDEKKEAERVALTRLTLKQILWQTVQTLIRQLLQKLPDLGLHCLQKASICIFIKEYVRSDPNGRDPDSTTILKIKQGHEPPTFTGFFGVWDREFFNNSKSLEEITQEIAAGNNTELVVEQEMNGGNNNFEQSTKYPLAKLQVASEELPDDVDAEFREMYLTEEDFQSIFGMSYGEFSNIPQWKQKNMKKQNKLW